MPFPIWYYSVAFDLGHLSECSLSLVVQVKLCRRILRALASNSQPQQQEREAVTLLKASLDPETLLTTSSMHDYEACLDTVLLPPGSVCWQAAAGTAWRGSTG